MLEETTNGIGAKIGVTASDSPYHRLRKLQQGNPRLLQFTYLWVGERLHVNEIEYIVKNGGKEWKDADAGRLRTLVHDLIKEQEFKVYEIIDSNVPYKHHSYGPCPWYQKKIWLTDIYSSITGIEVSSELETNTPFNEMFTRI